MNKGQYAEEMACNFLKNKGLKLVAQNYRCSFGEIDLIMQKENTLVFIEVRSRANSSYGGPIESIDSTKQQKLLKSASHYLQKHQLTDNIDCRFDVVGFSNNTIEWIEDAFSYE